jgi:hypothetical protein
MTEAELMNRLSRDLGPLAVDAQWSTAAYSGQPQGSYSDAIADAKEAAGVVGNLPAVTDGPTVVLVRRLALLACLERLELHYASLVDTTTTAGAAGEAVTQKLSQVRAAIGSVRTALVATVAAASAETQDLASLPTKATGFNLRGRRRPDYDVGTGNSVVEA